MKTIITTTFKKTINIKIYLFYKMSSENIDYDNDDSDILSYIKPQFHDYYKQNIKGYRD